MWFIYACKSTVFLMFAVLLFTTGSLASETELTIILKDLFVLLTCKHPEPSIGRVTYPRHECHLGEIGLLIQ